MTLPRNYLHNERWYLCRKHGEMEDGAPKWKPIMHNVSLDNIWERHQDFLFWGDISGMAQELAAQDEYTCMSDRDRSSVVYDIGEQTFQIRSEY